MIIDDKIKYLIIILYYKIINNKNKLVLFLKIN